jgi:hypothetical protein
MILADLAVAGFFIVLMMVAVVAAPWFLFSIYGLFESFRGEGSRGWAWVSFLVSGAICAYCASYLMWDVRFSSEGWQAAACGVAFVATIIVGFLFYVRMARRRRWWRGAPRVPRR